MTLVGFGSAFGGIPFYKAELGMCYITTPPSASTLIPVTLFYTLPVGFSLFILVTGCLALARFVRQQQKRSSKWNSKSKFSASTEISSSTNRGPSRVRKTNKKKDVFRQVFLRSVWYMASFLVTMPVMIIRNYSQELFENSNIAMMWLIIIAILGPSQGFLNALVFFYRNSGFEKLCRCCTNDAKHKRKPKEGNKPPLNQNNAAELGQKKPLDGATQKPIAPSQNTSLTLDSKRSSLEPSVKDAVSETPNAAQCDHRSKTVEFGEGSKINEGKVQAAAETAELNEDVEILEDPKTEPEDDNRAAAEEFLALIDDDGKIAEEVI